MDRMGKMGVREQVPGSRNGRSLTIQVNICKVKEDFSSSFDTNKSVKKPCSLINAERML